MMSSVLMEYGRIILNTAGMSGLRTQAGILDLTAPTGDGCIPIMAGHGYPAIPGAGRPSTTGAGYTTTGGDGYGSLVTTGRRHGWHGEPMVAIMAGRL